MRWIALFLTSMSYIASCNGATVSNSRTATRALADSDGETESTISSDGGEISYEGSSFAFPSGSIDGSADIKLKRVQDVDVLNDIPGATVLGAPIAISSTADGGSSFEFNLLEEATLSVDFNGDEVISNSIVVVAIITNKTGNKTKVYWDSSDYTVIESGSQGQLQLKTNIINATYTVISVDPIPSDFISYSEYVAQKTDTSSSTFETSSGTGTSTTGTGGTATSTGSSSASGSGTGDETLALNTVSAIRGSQSGGSTLRLTGTGFGSGMTVKVGDTTCGSVSVQSASAATCVTGASATTGSQNVVVTRSGVSTESGHAFNYVASDSWALVNSEGMPPAFPAYICPSGPCNGISAHSTSRLAAVTGVSDYWPSSVLVWANGSSRALYIYDPGNDSWTNIAPTGSGPGSSFVARRVGWTGSKLILFGYDTNTSCQGFIYTPATSTWIATATGNDLTTGDPTGARAADCTKAQLVSVGTKLVVYWAADTSNNFTFVLDVHNNTWTNTVNNSNNPFTTGSNEVALAPISSTRFAAVHSGFSGGLGSIFDTTSSSWSTIPDPGGSPFINPMAFVSTGTKLLGYGHGASTPQIGTYDIGGSWSLSAGPDSAATIYAQGATWTGSKMFIFGGVNTQASNAASNVSYFYTPGTGWSNVTTTQIPAGRISPEVYWIPGFAGIVVIGGSATDVAQGAYGGGVYFP